MSEPEPQSNPAVKELSGRIGKYEILKPLGKGAMGMVYLAHDTVLERDIALKVMVSSIADDPDLKRRFEREAKAVAKMTHPNVVAVFDLGSHTDGSPFIAMELLKGQDLQQAMRKPPPMSLDRKVAIIVQVLQGLAHAHQAGIVHRDIKPANIFINLDGTVKIMDFGVARLSSASMTGTGNIVGTADYMSPEQVRGAHVDGRSDLFSVGCMLFELLAGKRPFHSENLMAIFYKITHEEPNFDLIPAGDDYDALMPVLHKALAKNLEERHQTAYDFAVELRDYLKAHATSSTGQHALEGLLDLDEPPPPPVGTSDPGTSGSAGTLVTAGDDDLDDEPQGTMDLASGRAALSPTIARGPGTLGTGATRVGGSMAPTVTPHQAPTLRGKTGATIPPGTRATPTIVGKAPVNKAPAPLPPPPQPQSGPPVLYTVLGALMVALLGTVGYIALNHKTPPPPTVAVVTQPPPTTAAPVTTAPPATLAPPTTAPPPTFGVAQGKGAAAMKAGMAAFRSGDYDRALQQAQAALGEDPANADARSLVDKAQKGQQAAGHFKTAEAALAAKDYAKALGEAQAGGAIAGWDSRGPSLLTRINQAQQAAAQNDAAQKQSQIAAQVNALLPQAEAALNGRNFDGAIAVFDEVLKLDPNNQRAIVGRSGAISARAIAAAAATSGPATGGGKTFVVGKTVASAGPAAGAGPAGFEAAPGMDIKKTASADLPGKILFEVEPSGPKSGDKFTVKIFMVNEGSAPIAIKAMTVNHKINGRGATGPVAPQTKDLAPQQRALLLSLPDVWKEDTSQWSMEVAVQTVRGEKYTNQVTWK